MALTNGKTKTRQVNGFLNIFNASQMFRFSNFESEINWTIENMLKIEFFIF